MKLKGILLFVFVAVFLVGFSQTRIAIGEGESDSKFVILSGTVKDFAAGETLIGANLYIPSLGSGTTTDLDGYYEFKIEAGEYLIQFSSVGFETKEYQLTIVNSGKLDVSLAPDVSFLDEIQVIGEAPDRNIKSNDIGKQELSIKSIKELPAFAGEVDILKSIILLPGVSTAGETSSGFNIRGGSSDQNLILLGGAPLFNPSHLFGLFSAFNSDVVRSVSLFKGGVPPKFGGRGSSVLDIKYKDGNKNTWHNVTSLGTVSSKTTFEGPIIKNKLSVLMSGRISFVDWLLRTVDDPSIKNSSANFYDYNGRITYSLNDKNMFSYSHYRSFDEFNFASDTVNSWSNTHHVMDWKHTNYSKLAMDVNIYKSAYHNVIENVSSINQFQLVSDIVTYGGKFNLDYDLNDKLRFNMGVQSSLKYIFPGELTVSDSESAINNKTVESERGLESAAYINLEFDLSDNVSFTTGVRYNNFNYFGEKSINTYEEFVPKSEETIEDVTVYPSNESIIKYSDIDPRFTLRWSLSESFSVKAAYTRMHQYIHLISNTTAISPTNIWKLSDPFLKPQQVTQYSLGFFKNFRDNSIEASIEGYYKDLKNIVEYKDGAELILVDNIETELLSGIGRAYGLEFFLKKKTGRLTGWIGYTYSRSLAKVQGSYPIETINNGQWYSSNYDKPHDLTVVTKYQLSKIFTFSTNATYSTGRPVSYPSGKLEFGENLFAYFDSRNNVRIPDYARLDVSLSLKPNSKKKWLGGTWKFSIYNLLGRDNAFSVFFRDQEGAPPQPYKLSVISQPFPALSYELKF